MFLRWMILVGILAATLVQPAAGYLVEGKLGYPIDRYGTKYSASSGTISVKLNLLRGHGSAPYYGSWGELTSAERSHYASLIAEAVEYWHKVPDCALKLAYGGTTKTSTAVARRPYVLVTVGSLPSGVGGVGYSSRYGSQSIPVGVIVRPGSGLGTFVHEIGHQLGLGHSHCGWALTYNSTFGYSKSDGAFMSYSRYYTGPTLQGDDLAAIASTYPGSTFGDRSGSISGELVKSSCKGIFGANVFVVDSHGKAVVARLSGMHEYASAALHGKFKLPRLTPGTYTLVAASPYDSTYRTGSPHGGYTKYDSYSPTSLAVSVIKGIVVEAGGDTAIGSIVAGTHKTLSDGGSSTPEPEAEPEPEPQDTTASRTLSWSPISGATYYYIQVYSHEAGKWVVRRAVSTTSVTFETTPGKHTVYLHAYISGRWWRVASQSMTL